MMSDQMFGFNTKRQYLNSLRSQLINEQSSFLPVWRECGDLVSPYRQRYMTQDRNRGDRRNKNIINSSASMALRTLKAGMMSGITSPARPWFRLTTNDPDMAEFGRVKEWLDIVSRRMINVFLKSNFYGCLPNVYGDMGTFANAAMSLEEDFENVLFCQTFPIGSYRFFLDEFNRPRGFQRDFSLTVRQLLRKFGKIENGKISDWSNFSSHVKNLYDNGNLEAWIDVSHTIYPNEGYKPESGLAKDKLFSSCYVELGTGSMSNKGYDSGEETYLRESGYDYFPMIIPRWETVGEDVYGTDCPAITSVSDIKMLQQTEKLALQGFEKTIRPAMLAPTSLKKAKVSSIPGDVTWVPDEDTAKVFRQLMPIDFRMDLSDAKAREIENRISRAFYEDLFLMLAQSDRREITAREIDERKEEKLLALGQVLGQFNQDGSDPSIDIAFTLMGRQGMIPPPPEELQGQPLKVEYMSILSQAQKLIGAANIERFMGNLQALLPVAPEIAYKVNTHQLVDVYGDILSVPAGVIRPDDEAEGLQQQAQQAAAAQQKAASMRDVSGSVRDLASADLEGDNALSRLLKQGQGQQAGA